MLSDGLFRGAHIFKGCSRHSSLKEWLSPGSSCDIRSIRREVDAFPSDIAEQPKKVGDFVEVRSTAMEYMRKVRCYLVASHFIVAREKMWKPREDTRRYEIDDILMLSDHTFYFSGEVLIVESRAHSTGLCRYFELCDDSSVNIWKLLFRQCGCLGPDITDEENNEPKFVISDDGQIDSEELASALSPPAFFVYPRQTQSNTMLHDINNTLDRSGQKDLMLSKHLCCSENCLLDISHSEARQGKRRRVSSCSSFRCFNNKSPSSTPVSAESLKGCKKKEKLMSLKSMNNTLSRKFKTSSCRLQKSDVCQDTSPHSNPTADVSSFQRGLQLNVYNIKPEHFAQQLTYLDRRYLLAVSPREILHYDKIDDSRCSNIREAVSFFNHVSNLVVHLILQELTPRARARLIRYLITVSEKLRAHNNYSSLRAIIAGLQSNPIYRLEKTWKLIKGQSRKSFNSLVEIWKHNNNYENYQTLLEKGLQRGSFIPFMGLFFNQVVMTSLILKELKIQEIDLYPIELEGPWDDAFTRCEETEAGCSSAGLLAQEEQDEEVLSINLDSICLSPCFPATPSSFTRKLKRLKKKPLHAGEVGWLPGVERILDPIARSIAKDHPRTKVLQIQHLPPYLLRRYQLAASLLQLNDRPAVNFFIFKDKLMSEKELRALSLQRES